MDHSEHLPIDFRPRMVEIAARDAEPGVRADTIELLDKLRDAELLEPDDIDVYWAAHIRL